MRRLDPLLAQIKQRTDAAQRRIGRRVQHLRAQGMTLSDAEKAALVRGIERDSLQIETLFVRASGTCNLSPHLVGCDAVNSGQTYHRYRNVMRGYRAAVARSLDKSTPEWRTYLQATPASETKGLSGWMWGGLALVAGWYLLRKK